jgi:hypothetical protein
VPVKFQGGINTVIEQALLETGALSKAQNVRNRHPGLEQRLGMARQHTTTDGAQEIIAIHQYIDRAGTKHLFAQRADGEVHQASNNPPTTTTGDYSDGTAKIAAPSALTNLLPASFSKVNDMLLYSDNERQHQIYSGEGARIGGCMIYKGITFTGSGLDDCAGGGTYSGVGIRWYKVAIDTTGTPDQFDWWYSIDNGDNWVVGAGDVAITGAAQTLDNGFTVTFGATTGHTTADQWVFRVYDLLTVLESGENRTDEMIDENSSTVADIGGMRKDGDRDALFVMTMLPANKLTFTVGNTDSNSRDVTISYWRNDSSNLGWADTSNSATDFDTAGDVSSTWTSQSDEVPRYLFGRFGYWYKITFADALDSTTTLTKITYESNYQAITNDWDGLLDFTIEAKLKREGDSTNTMWDTWGTNAIPVGGMKDEEFIYVSTVDKAQGFFIDPSGAPNIVSAKVSGTDISFVDNGSDLDYIVRAEGDFIKAGFEIGMTFTVAGSTSNNVTKTIARITADRLYMATGSLTGEAAGDSVTITYDNVTTIDQVDVWDGEEWQSLGNVDDGTIGLSQAGFVMFQLNQVPEEIQFQQAVSQTFWYRLRVNCAEDKISANVNIGIQYLPIPNLDGVEFGTCNAAWKKRGVYSNRSKVLFISSSNKPNSLNGIDFAVIEAGDGRSNEIRAMRPFHNELMVWQKEEGTDGGCVTLIEGFDPQTFGRLVLSNRVGCMNDKSVEVLDGVATSTRTDERIKTVGFFLSKSGVMATDGSVIFAISDDIQNYFNPEKSECINLNYIDKMWLKYDESSNTVQIGLVSGSSATVPNIFPVLDVASLTWTFDVRGAGEDSAEVDKEETGMRLSCMANIEAASGNDTTIQVGGSVSDGFIYILNTGTNDVGVLNIGVDADVAVVLNGDAQKLMYEGCDLRVKAQSAGVVKYSIAREGNPTFSTERTFPMTAETSGDTVRRLKIQDFQQASMIEQRFRNDKHNQTLYLLDEEPKGEQSDVY